MIMYCLTVDISGKGEARTANTPLVERLPNYSELLDINMVWPVISDGELSLFTQQVSNSAATNRSRARESRCEGECKTRTADTELSGRVCQTQRRYRSVCRDWPLILSSCLKKKEAIMFIVYPSGFHHVHRLVSLVWLLGL